MLHKGLFILAHQFGDTAFYSTYKRIVRNQWKPYDELERDQEKQLRYLMKYVYNNIPYYHNLLKRLKLLPTDINVLEDLEKIPILTKDIIKGHWEEFKPVNLSSMKHYCQATGGSTGTPMEYRLSKPDRFLGGALLYRGWGYGGYHLGDRMVFLAGSSLNVGTNTYLVKKVHEKARNIRKLSSFDMGEPEMREYAGVLNSFKPLYMRGYPSSLYFYAKWLEENKVSVHCPKVVFTTSEKLFPQMRETIRNVFDCDVFDNYGLNDGGISAYECSEHNGLHIDTERSIMEVVDDDDHQMRDGRGQILATSLNNYAMPFIRYFCGDEGVISDEVCNCGRGSHLLKEVIGRTTDMLITPEGKNIHGWFLLYIFWEYGKGIKEYQVVQKTIDKILIRIVPESDIDERQLDNIRRIIHDRSPGWDIEFKYVDKIEKSSAGKKRFIINEVSYA